VIGWRIVATFVIAIFSVACSSVHTPDTQRIELITNPVVRCILQTDIDSLAKAFDHVQCAHIEGCNAGYHSVDTTFAIGFTLDILRDKENASSLVMSAARIVQTERIDIVDLPIVDNVANCGNCAYGHYTHDTPVGPTSYFFGVVVSNGYSVGVSYQLVNAEKDKFVLDGIKLLQGIRIEPY
jgi:hypothetical protein